MCLCLEGESLGCASQSPTQWTGLAAEQEFTLCFQTPWAGFARQERSAGGIFYRVFISMNFLHNIWLRMWLLIHFVVWVLYSTSELWRDGCGNQRCLCSWLDAWWGECSGTASTSAAASPHGFCVLQNTLLWERLPPRKNSFISFKSLLECWWKKLFSKETELAGLF